MSRELAGIVSRMKPKTAMPVPAKQVDPVPLATLPAGIIKRASGYYAVGQKLFRTLSEATDCLREQSELTPVAQGE